MCHFKKLFTVLIFVVAVDRRAQGQSTPNADSAQLKLEKAPAEIWTTGIGEGLNSKTQSLSVEAGATKGVSILGSKQAHDLALFDVTYGHVLGHMVGEGHFYRGNWELRLEAFGGLQFLPDSEWVLGVAPHLRYDFMTGTKFVPFIDVGAGVSATSIGPPDLSNIFEFNLQGTIGTQYFLRPNLALTLEARYFHLSCAGISNPNLGLNTIAGMVGLSFLF